jgi:hypothetical protein
MEGSLKEKFSFGAKENRLPLLPYSSTGQAIILSTVILYE